MGLSKRTKRAFSRVDMQVSLLTAIMIIIVSLSVFMGCYQITYKDMIRTLKDRVMSIHSYVESSLDKELFSTLNVYEDMETDMYKRSKELLDTVRRATGVRYLYTAKRNDSGELIYVVDGLDYSAHDFRYPGDLIEEEITEDLSSALLGNTIMPNDIRQTDWGPIFIAYLPIHGADGSVIGVIGIEFPADHQYAAYLLVRWVTIISAAVFTLISSLIAVIIFRRISNPNYRDLANTDRFTQLKNRNAFDVTMNNLQAKRLFEGMGIISIDLDNLKKVNDELGHSKGDEYIKMVANTINALTLDNMAFYRTGGDEFVGIMHSFDEQSTRTIIGGLQFIVEGHSSEIGRDISVSVGYAAYDSEIDSDIHATYKRADMLMYENKREKRVERRKN